mmetsp:Transcript_108978/g.307143  ORF Transcript_108978/g.307143 Transcript_108978/m.307143 type:complete len:210 (+) Transcript_108978:786-1415(+)
MSTGVRSPFCLSTRWGVARSAPCCKAWSWRRRAHVDTAVPRRWSGTFSSPGRALRWPAPSSAAFWSLSWAHGARSVSPPRCHCACSLRLVTMSSSWRNPKRRLCWRAKWPRSPSGTPCCGQYEAPLFGVRLHFSWRSTRGRITTTAWYTSISTGYTSSRPRLAASGWRKNSPSLWASPPIGTGSATCPTSCFSSGSQRLPRRCTSRHCF